MTTTFEKYDGTQPGNYCDLPTRDVEIIENPTLHCLYCDAEVVYFKVGWSGEWKHKNNNVVHASGSNYVCNKGVCRYCGSEDIKFSKEAWYDRTECMRCGGVHGFAIGD